MAYTLIFTNKDKRASFHINNLAQNNIRLTTNQIKWLIQKIRQVNYPKDDDFIKDISKITITYENLNNMVNLPLCYKIVNTINPEKKNRLEKYIIFTSSFQINLLSKCTQVFVDGTFKSCPRGYYQILNVAAYYEEINGIIPIFMIPISGKS